LTPEQQQAFEKVKNSVAEAPILKQHDPELQDYMKSDASGGAIGLVLEQKGEDGKLRPVAFTSLKYSIFPRRSSYFCSVSD
jgi:hypothetical protein